MSPGARLQDLTAKYMQNPRRFFVPLANEYRLAGELDRAIALCREHLPSQPGHMSGHIVLGRAYFEKGDTAAAREVFLTSVALDDENVIALRHLGDIARLQNDLGEARQWYARVLDADPQNAEIERLLRSLNEATRPVASPAPVVAPPPVAETVRPPVPAVPVVAERAPVPTEPEAPEPWERRPAAPAQAPVAEIAVEVVPAPVVPPPAVPPAPAPARRWEQLIDALPDEVAPSAEPAPWERARAPEPVAGAPVIPPPAVPPVSPPAPVHAEREPWERPVIPAMPAPTAPVAPPAAATETPLPPAPAPLQPAEFVRPVTQAPTAVSMHQLPPSDFDLADAAAALSEPTPPGLKAILADMPPSAREVVPPPAFPPAPRPAQLEQHEEDAAPAYLNLSAPLAEPDDVGESLDALPPIDGLQPASELSQAREAEALPLVADSEIVAEIRAEPVDAFPGEPLAAAWDTEVVELTEPDLVSEAVVEPLPAVGQGFTFDELDALVSPDDAPAFPQSFETAEPASLDDALLPTVLESEPMVPAEPIDVGVETTPVTAELETSVATPAEPPAPPAAPAFGGVLASLAAWRNARERETPLAPSVIAAAPTQPAAASESAYAFAPDGDESVPADALPAAGFETETMAQLYEQQGYPEQALGVYRALARRTPTDSAIQERIRDLEQRIEADGEEKSLEQDADKALAFNDFGETGEIVSNDPSLEPLADVALHGGAAASHAAGDTSWRPAPSAEDAGDDWFAEEQAAFAGEPPAEVGSDPIFGTPTSAFASAVAIPTPRDSRAVTDGQYGSTPSPTLASMFAGREIAGSDAAASTLLGELAAQMVGRLPKDAPTLPVPDVLELPVSPGSDSATAPKAPLLSFDRFFAGSGSPPRQRIDTPTQGLRPTGSMAPIAPVPLVKAPSLSPTFGGLPVVPPPPPVPMITPEPQPEANRVPVAPVAQPGTPPIATWPTPVSARPVAPVTPRSSAPVEPEPVVYVTQRPVTPATPIAAVQPAEPAAPDTAAPDAPTSGVAEPRTPPTDFHRWLEGLS